jgi:hypothetical protein
LVPTDLGDSMIDYPVNRQIRHWTLMRCISASGYAYHPLLVAAKDSVSQTRDLPVRDGMDVRIRIAQSPHIAKKMFPEGVRDVVVPTVEVNRDLPGCQAKPAVIFCEYCSCPYFDDILQGLANHGILLITYPPRASHIFQMLDVMLFRRLKSAEQCLPYHQDLEPQVDRTICVFRASDIATTSMTIRGSWEKPGFGFIRRNDTCCRWVNENKIRRNPEFQEVSQLDWAVRLQEIRKGNGEKRCR